MSRLPASRVRLITRTLLSETRLGLFEKWKRFEVNMTTFKKTVRLILPLHLLLGTDESCPVSLHRRAPGDMPGQQLRPAAAGWL